MCYMTHPFCLPRFVALHVQRIYFRRVRMQWQAKPPENVPFLFVHKGRAHLSQVHSSNQIMDTVKTKFLYTNTTYLQTYHYSKRTHLLRRERDRDLSSEPDLDRDLLPRLRPRDLDRLRRRRYTLELLNDGLLERLRSKLIISMEFVSGLFINIKSRTTK